MSLPPRGGRHATWIARWRCCLALVVPLLVISTTLARPSSVQTGDPVKSPNRLRVEGRTFRTADGSRFSWRGITAFRLAELVAHGRTSQAVEFLDWARSQRLTVVRVLAMADVLFKLSPQEGRTALPRLLLLAAGRGLYVEVVALADTDRIGVALDDQVREVGAVCAASPNCILELANEPWARHTQRPETGDPARLLALRALVSREVPVALGSAAADDSNAFAAGDYVTVHVSRDEGEGGWRSVARMRVVEALSARTGKPVVDDEPIGAAEVSQPGRRDADADRWFARGALARLLGIGATFHYEGGLAARLPRGQEAACFSAWQRGLETLPAGLEARTSVKAPASAGAAIVSFEANRAVGVFLAQGEREAWAVAVGVTGKPAIRWRQEWRVESTWTHPGVMVVETRR